MEFLRKCRGEHEEKNEQNQKSVTSSVEPEGKSERDEISVKCTVGQVETYERDQEDLKCVIDHRATYEQGQNSVKRRVDPEEKCERDQQPLKVLASYDLVNFCIQIAAGMNFLHSKGVFKSYYNQTFLLLIMS